MMANPLTREQLEELERFPTPMVCNAIEMFGVRRQNEGFMMPDIACRFPDLGVMVGYAATATFRAWEPDASGKVVDMAAYYDHILAQPFPRVLVAHDLDERPVGALFGEVNSSLHRALGCAGHITDGGARDLDECRAIGFHLFSGCVQVSHAYVHLEDFGGPVAVGGLTVPPGGLLHADKHGVCLIPAEIAGEVAAACEAMEALERPLIDLARSPEFTPLRFAAARNDMKEQYQEACKRFRR
ncbi:MAG: RraA family protein [Armatimonadetes bacterium]|nr:RraA family protein [Armatimonadota bacterium]